MRSGCDQTVRMTAAVIAPTPGSSSRSGASAATRLVISVLGKLDVQDEDPLGHANGLGASRRGPQVLLAATPDGADLLGRQRSTCFDVAQHRAIGAGAFGSDQHAAEISARPAADPVPGAAKARRCRREGGLVDQRTVRRTNDDVAMGSGVGVDPDDVLVEVSHDGRQDVRCSPHLFEWDVVAGVSPGEKSRRGGPVMSHTTETAIAVVDMLLIKLALGARVGAAPRARRTDPGHDTPEGSGDSGVTTRTG